MENRAASSRLPKGETDPNKLYIAVGKAIHSWEGLEEALARLWLKLTGTEYTPSNLAAYGSANRRFIDRANAVRIAADSYFVKRPHQGIEGEFQELFTATLDLAIERHRIAHGHVTIIAEMQLPESKGVFDITATALYRWGAPFYSTDSLRTDPFGIGADQIDVIASKFMAMHNGVNAFTERLFPA